MTTALIINAILMTTAGITIVSLLGWAILTADRDRTGLANSSAGRPERRAASRPMPTHLERRRHGSRVASAR